MTGGSYQTDKAGQKFGIKKQPEDCRKEELKQQGTVKRATESGDSFKYSLRGTNTIPTSIGTRGFQWTVAMGNYDQKETVKREKNSGDYFNHSLGKQRGYLRRKQYQVSPGTQVPDTSRSRHQKKQEEENKKGTIE